MYESKVRYRVRQVSESFSNLSPIAVSVSEGQFDFQDYLTVEQARDLATKLNEASYIAECRAAEKVTA